MLAASPGLAETPPEGFTSLFDGKDFSGWRAENPHDYVKLRDAKKIAAKRKKDLEVFPVHWQIKDGVIINDGHGPYLCTEKDYGDVEFLVDFRLDANSDSGIYMRGTPQVQIWDTREEAGKWKHGADKGSGGLWNNKGAGAGKHPLVHADKPIGEWNRLRIRQIGSRTWVWLNDKLVVDGVYMQNFWKRDRPLAKLGPIILQTHGAPVAWRNIAVREILPVEADKILAEAASGDGWVSLFDGSSTKGWKMQVADGFKVIDGALVGGKGAMYYDKKAFSDFKLALEFKLPPGGNNGLLIRYPGKGNGSYVGMCELQVLDDTADKYKDLDERQFHGSAYGMIAAHRGYLRPVGEWNHQIVTVQGSRIQVELNGVPILDGDLRKVKQFMENKAHPGIKLTEGFIGFAGHGDLVSFRNIRVKDLAAKAAHKAAAPGALLAPTVSTPAAQPEPRVIVLGDDVDEEQMRLTKLIRERILKQVEKDAHKATPAEGSQGKATPAEGSQGKATPAEGSQGKAYTEELDNGVSFEMLPVKGGSFRWQGDQADDVIEATISPFWMGKYEVTWEEYEPFMITELPREKDGQVVDFMRETIEDDGKLMARPTPPYHPMTYGMPREGHPAVSMTQHAANKYCQWLSYKTGHFYRLPTEAEWEYACRAGSTTKFSWGDDAAKAGEYALIGGDASSTYDLPGQKKPNAWGFYDMHGNVLEWTLDQHVDNRLKHFGNKAQKDPWVIATKAYPHVTKGGYWQQDIEAISSAARHPSRPDWKASDPQSPKSLWYHTDTPWLGMRLVRPANIPSLEEMYRAWNSGVAEDGEMAAYR